jgi:endonuclease YncB( thermonuclease family)
MAPGTKTLVALLACLLWAAGALAQDTLHGRVVGVTDGDTLKVLTAEKQLLRVRVSWIDAPEMGQAFGQRAKQAMSALVFGKDVELQFHTVDRYGRLVCMVFVDGKDACLALVKQGLAWKFDRYLPEASLEVQQSYTAAEAAARAARTGLWASGDEPQPPWEFRKTEREQRVQNMSSHEP